MGAEIRAADLKDVESLKKALSGVDAVVSALGGEAILVHIGFSLFDLQYEQNLYEAIKDSKITRFIPSRFTGSKRTAYHITFFHAYNQ